MERMRFKTEINAPVSRVFETMLGRDTFKLWTAVFNPSSDFVGTWEKGAKILFVGIDKEGKKEGMIGIVKELEPNKYVSIEYTGILDGDVEITEGPQIDDWAGGFENYTFSENGNRTTVLVEVDVNDEMKKYFQDTYPRALEKLKEICE